MAETGVHCITDPANIKQVVSPGELVDLGGMYDKNFVLEHPEFVEHFAEYNPSRVPRMLSRASHIDNMAKPALETIAEATQLVQVNFIRLCQKVFKVIIQLQQG